MYEDSRKNVVFIKLKIGLNDDSKLYEVMKGSAVVRVHFPAAILVLEFSNVLILEW